MKVKEKFMLSDLIALNYEKYGLTQFKEVNLILEENKSIVQEDYLKADEEENILLNRTSVIECILLENISNDFIATEIEGILISSTSLYSIAEKIKDNKLSEIIDKLSVNGSWILYRSEGSFHLSKKWNKS